MTVGGLAVTVAGAGFDRSHVVKMGVDVCETISVSLTEIVCLVPAVSDIIDALAIGARSPAVLVFPLFPIFVCPVLVFPLFPILFAQS